MYDIIIIGSGPAGLSAALSAKRLGLEYLTLERGVIADTIYHFPIARDLFSTADELELEPGDLNPKSKPTREQLLYHYVNVVRKEQLNIWTGSEVLSITRGGESFEVSAATGLYYSRTVLVAAGGFGKQRRLNVSGENPSRVSYRFSEAHPYALKEVLVVGGGNSAAEAALWLAEAGAQVTLAIRRGSLDLDPADKQRNPEGIQIKPWVRQPLDLAIAQGPVRLLTSACITAIGEDSASVLVGSAEPSGSCVAQEVRCDHIFALIGADPDTALIENAGAAISSDGRPVYDQESYETTIEGLYVSGHITRERHIKKAIAVGRMVVERIARDVFAQCPA